jgi:hypothetical protein
MIPTKHNINAKVTTIDAPEGRSSVIDAIIPKKLPSTPNTQPKSNRCRVLSTKSMAATAGIMRKENTSNTPAILTEIVTTNPKVT